MSWGGGAQGPDSIISRILARRSYRQRFSEHPVAHDDLEQIVACGLAAPSSKNAQPWRLHVVTDQTLMREIANKVRASPNAPSYVPWSSGDQVERWVSTVIESADILADAGAAIFIENLGYFGGGHHAGTELAGHELGSWLISFGFEMIGIGAAIENMWLAAESLGLAAVFIGDVGVEDDFIRDRLAFSGDLVGVHVFGYPTARGRPRPSPPDQVLRVCWHEARHSS